MSEWQSLLDSADKSVIDGAGYGQTIGIGTAPCLLIVDAQQEYFGDPTQGRSVGVGIGEAAWGAALQIGRMVEFFRAQHLPVIYTVNMPVPGVDIDRFAAKRTATLTVPADPIAARSLIIAPLAPTPHEPVLAKHAASAFFGTPLDIHLRTRDVDTIIVGGVSTSGCVRASVVDAVSLGYRVTVLRDGVADRIDLSHRVALLDMWMKYADLKTTDQVLRVMQGISANGSGVG